jgi:hypothetical protein
VISNRRGIPLPVGFLFLSAAQAVAVSADTLRHTFALGHLHDNPGKLVELWMVRTHGRFLDDYRHAPIKIVNHFSRQLGPPSVSFLDRSGREPAERSRHSGFVGIWA